MAILTAPSDDGVAAEDRGRERIEMRSASRVEREPDQIDEGLS
jgi:hypothetical protein